MSYSLRDSGEKFIEYLRTREGRVSVKQLRDFYDEFQGREPSNHPSPNFDKVLNALKRSNRIRIKHSVVHMTEGSQPRDYCDQWRRPRGPRPQTPSCGPEEPATASPGPSAAGAPAPALTPKQQRASRVQKELQVNREKLFADKQGIEITSTPEASGGEVRPVVETLGETFLIRFHIENKGPDGVNLTDCALTHGSVRCFALEDERRVTRACPVPLGPGDSHDVVARYRLNDHGYFRAMICFEFSPVDTSSKSQPFSIAREMAVDSIAPPSAQLGPVAPYKRLRPFARKAAATKFVMAAFSERPLVDKPKTAVTLGHFQYPAYLKTLAKRNLSDSQDLSAADRSNLATVKSRLSGPLEMKNYHHRFHLLLHLEEMQMEVDIRKYDLHNQTMSRDPDDRTLLTLTVPGVAENRPSVLRGDSLRVSISGDTSETVYPGRIRKVELDRVKLSFTQKLLERFHSNMKFDVAFTFNRYTLKLQHRAVDTADRHHLGDVLFPSSAAAAAAAGPSSPPAAAAGPSPPPPLRMFNRDLEKNPEQRAAVQHIVAGSSKPAPYLVFGPPGTGKTSTLVEAMNQVLEAEPSAHILACAPSNSACDLLLDKLKVPTDDRVYRLNAYSRDPRSVAKHLLDSCNWDEEEREFVFPGKETLMSFKVVVATLFTAGRLVSRGIPLGHFTHVFVDEAGQATEPECVIAVAGVLDPRQGQLVLAGDPMQLGPVVRSPLALHHGLDLSLLKRLMTDNALYRSKDARFVTKLLRNYRSHAAILKIPNELFYDNEVQEFAERRDRETYCRWGHLPREGFPVIFHGLSGRQEREASSPSFFNRHEVEVLVGYLTKLLETQGKDGLPKLSGKHIGIIAPYRKQVEKIQKALKEAPALRQWSEIKEIKVGCVEEFQGEERKIIMVSTVRSNTDYLKRDKDFNIGFLSNPKRFNVAVTRATSLLIVVGSPTTLNTDPCWEKFISYCVEEKGYRGVDFRAPPQSEDDGSLAMAQLSLRQEDV